MLKHIDMEAAIRRLAERKVDQAIEEGKFDRLEGAGKPIDLEPMPADENARMMWWAMRLLKRNDVVPDEVKYRKLIDERLSTLMSAKDEAELRSRVAAVNELIRRLNTMGTNIRPTDLAMLDPDLTVAEWRSTRG